MPHNFESNFCKWCSGQHFPVNACIIADCESQSDPFENVAESWEKWLKASLEKLSCWMAICMWILDQLQEVLQNAHRCFKVPTSSILDTMHWLWHCPTSLPQWHWTCPCHSKLWCITFTIHQIILKSNTFCLRLSKKQHFFAVPESIFSFLVGKH